MFDKDTHAELRSALSRIEFTNVSHGPVLRTLVQRAKQLRETHRRVLVVAGRSKRFHRADVAHELKQLVEEQRCTDHEMVQNTVGDVGAAFVGAGVASGVVVVQAAGDKVVEV